MFTRKGSGKNSPKLKTDSNPEKDRVINVYNTLIKTLNNNNYN